MTPLYKFSILLNTADLNNNVLFELDLFYTLNND